MDTEGQINDTLKRLQSRKGVEGVMVLDYSGLVIVSTFEADESKGYARSIAPLLPEAKKAVTSINPKDDVTLIRLMTKNHEIMATPGEKYVMVVLQKRSGTQQTIDV